MRKICLPNPEVGWGYNGIERRIKSSQIKEMCKNHETYCLIPISLQPSGVISGCFKLLIFEKSKIFNIGLQ